MGETPWRPARRGDQVGRLERPSTRTGEDAIGTPELRHPGQFLLAKNEIIGPTPFGRGAAWEAAPLFSVYAA